ncbi:MAG: ABC transporter substrate-binding protein [Actinomycetota bacterium]
MNERPRRRLSRRELLVAGTGAGAALFLAGCGGSAREQISQTDTGGEFGAGDTYEGPTVELEFWNGFTGGDGPFMTELVKRFQSENDNITISQNTIEWVQYYQKVPAAVKAGKGPDLGIMHVDTLATNAARQVIVPLDDLATALDLQEEDFQDIVWNAGIYADQRYGIPLDIHPLGFYYNKTVMEQGGVDPESPPQTREDYEAALEQMKSNGIEGGWVSPFIFTGGFMFLSLLWQHGGLLTNEDATEATFNSQEGVDAMTWMVGLVENGFSPKNVAQDSDATAFIDNRNAFIWNGPWAINEYGGTKGLDWGVATLPQIGPQQGAWAGSHNFVIMNKPDQDPNKFEAAKVFISWISQQSIEWAKAGQVPARESVRASRAFKNLDEQTTFAEELPYVNFPPSVPGIADALLPLYEVGVNEAVLLKSSPQEALDKAAEQVTSILQENAQKYGYA